MTVWAYYRVSTDKQDYKSQKIGVVEYAKRNNLEIDHEIIDDGVSGTVVAKRRKLQIIMQKMKKGDTVITSELSRLGRNLSDIILTCDTFIKKGVNCCLVKQNMTIDHSPIGKLLIAVFGAFAELERDLISQRTAEGLRRVKESGKKLGRPKGRLSPRHTTDGKEVDVLAFKTMGYSDRQTARFCGISAPTVKRLLCRLKEKNEQMSIL